MAQGTDQVEIWKKIVDVQQHFNDLELRIRNFAIIVVGAFLGLGGYALKERDFTSFLGPSITLACPIVLSALLPLFAFYLMDRLWYHRLLDGAVKAGIEAESSLRDLGLKVDLGGQISKSSPFTIPLVKWKVHSRHKMDGFYGLLALAILALGISLGVAVDQPDPSTSSAEAAPVRFVPQFAPQTPPVASTESLPAATTNVAK